MYHILVLIYTLSGQPVGVAKAPEDVAYPSKETCEAALAETLVTTQKFLDEYPDEKIRGKFKAVDAKCFSNEDIEKIKQPSNPLREGQRKA